jgi:hypothetical protein
MELEVTLILLSSRRREILELLVYNLLNGARFLGRLLARLHLLPEELVNRSLHLLAFLVLEQVDTLMGRRFLMLAGPNQFAQCLLISFFVATDNGDLRLATDTVTCFRAPTPVVGDQ